MRITRIDELKQWVVCWQGIATWFDNKKDAESYMRSIEDSLLFQ